MTRLKPGAGPELDVPTGARRHFLLDAIAMALLVGEGEEDLELGHRKR